ncbi:hypothetical protein QVD17_20933 [Tagetes erecta]|uniref:F-box domain-containing protein n=1 Tax=Tagetes erecta TaxID=13708 RepID=A0AAD8KM54_TARER|nr:hypothetical protein QVD17_20933 [Tagetes erecta]
MKPQCLNLDKISTLPEHIIEYILTLMPIRDAFRTSILSKRWRYCWRTMPKLVFTDDMVTVPSSCRCGPCGQLNKYKLLDAIDHVLSLHNGRTQLEFNCIISEHVTVSEIDKIIINYLANGNNVTEMTFIQDVICKLPVSFYSLEDLESIYFQRCEIELPSNFNGFSRLTSLTFVSVEVSAPMLQQFLSKCLLIEDIYLNGFQTVIDFAPEGTKFTFVDLLQYVPLIKGLFVSKYYMKYLSAGGMPRTLPNSLVYLECLFLDVCLMEQNEISAALCLIKSSPTLEQISILVYMLLLIVAALCNLADIFTCFLIRCVIMRSCLFDQLRPNFLILKATQI